MIILKEGKICMKGNVTIHINKKKKEEKMLLSITNMLSPYNNYEYYIYGNNNFICMNIDSNEYYYTL